MKGKIITGLLMTVMAFSLVACGGANTGNNEPAGDVKVQTNPEPSDENTETGDTVSADDIKEAYMDFLKGNRTMVVKKDIEGLEMEKEYSYDEMVEAFSEYYSEESYDYVLSAGEYAYIDCGADSVPELALHHSFAMEMDELDMYSVLKYINGQVCLVNSLYGYYRSYIYINEYGYIEYGGSNGALNSYCDYRYINKDGEEIFLYSLENGMGLSGAYISDFNFPGHEAPEGYPEDIYSYEDIYVTCDMYNFTEYEYQEDGDDEEYYRNYFYTFYDNEGNYVEPEVDIAKIYLDNGIAYYTPEEAKNMVEEHIKSLGVTDNIRNGGPVEWDSLLAAGVGEYTKILYGTEGTMSYIPGKWIIPKDLLGDEVAALYLSIEETGEFEININYADSHEAPSYISGHLVFEESDYANTGFYFYPTNSNSQNFPEKTYLGCYFIDKFSEDSEKIQMTLYCDSEDVFRNYCRQDTLQFEKEYTDEYYDTYRVVYNPSEEYFYGKGEEDTGSIHNITLKERSCTENGIIDEDVWFQRLGIQWNQDNYSDDKYTYSFGGDEYYGRKTLLYIYEKASGKLVRIFDFHDFIYAEGYENNDFVDRSIRYAFIEGDTLYVNLYHSTYASSCPSNAYIMAIDMEYGYVEWKSEPLVSNSNNFIVLGDIIITGYGFTAEDHYLCLVNKYSGEVVSRINIKKSPEYFFYKDNVLYVRTYSYDYEYDVSEQ